MAKENKTKATDVSVEAFIAAIPNAGRRAECEAVAAMMQRVTGCPPRMWGPSIVGFGTLHYRYDSGREGEMCEAGFASRREGLVVYLTPDAGPRQTALLAELGPYTMSKSCLYLKKLADVDGAVLEALVVDSIEAARRRHRAC